MANNVSNRVHAENVGVTLYDGGPQDGTPFYGQAIPIETFLNSLDVTETSAESDMSGAGENFERTRAGKGSHTVDIDIMINKTGIVNIPKGNYIRMVYEPVDGGAISPGTYDGVVLTNSFRVNKGDAQTQRIRFKGPAD